MVRKPNCGCECHEGENSGFLPLWQVAQFFGVCPNTVRNWSIRRKTNEQRLQPYRERPKHPSVAPAKDKRQYYFRREDVENWMEPVK